MNILNPFLAVPGKARGYSTNSVTINSFIWSSFSSPGRHMRGSKNQFDRLFFNTIFWNYYTIKYFLRQEVNISKQSSIFQHTFFLI